MSDATSDSASASGGYGLSQGGRAELLCLRAEAAKRGRRFGWRAPVLEQARRA